LKLGIGIAEIKVSLSVIPKLVAVINFLKGLLTENGQSLKTESGETLIP